MTRCSRSLESRIKVCSRLEPVTMPSVTSLHPPTRWMTVTLAKLHLFPRTRLVQLALDSPLYVVLHLSVSLSLSPSPSLWDEYWQWPALGFIHRSLSDPLWEKRCLCLSELNAEHLSSSWTQCEAQRSQTVLIDVAPPPVPQRVEIDFCYALSNFP